MPARASNAVPVPSGRGTGEPFLAAVERLMLRGGRFHELSIAEIAREAGAARSTFYLHFTDKTALVRALIASVADELLDATNPTDDFVGEVSLPMMRMAVVRLLRTYRRHVGRFSAIAECAAADATVDAEYRAMIERTSFIREETFHRLRAEAGDTTPREDPQALFRCLAWMTERAVSQYVTTGTPAEVTDDPEAMAIADALAVIIWRTLYE